LSDSRRVVKNILFVYSGNIICAIIIPVFYVFIARLLGADSFGVYSFSVSLAGIFSIFSEFGISKLIIREISSDKSKASLYFGELLVLKPILAMLVLLFFTLLILFANKNSEAKLAAVLIGINYIFLGSFFKLFDGIFQAYEDMKISSALNILANFLSALLGIIIIFFFRNLIALSVALIASSVIVSSLALLVLLRKLVKPKTKFDIKLWKSLLRDASPFAATGFFIVIFSYSDIVMISLINGDRDVGIYSAAYKIVWALLMLPTAVMATLYPYLSRKRGASNIDSVSIIEDVVINLLIIILPIITIIGIFSFQIINIIYGSEYYLSAEPLSVLISIPILGFMYIPLYDFLNVHYHQRTNARNLMICTTINIALNSFLIPFWSYNGASIATLISEFLLFSFTYYYSAKLEKVRLPINKLINISASEGILFLTLFLLPKEYWYFSSAIGLLLYLTCLIWLRVLDINRIKQMFKS
jgi:O-antigen/teichoic acid export membrane protein